MKKILFCFLLSFFVIAITDARNPNPSNAVENCGNRCAEVAKRCNKACNRPGATNKDIMSCNQQCAKESAQCHSSCQIHVQQCAKDYAYCVRNATTDKAKQQCAAGYHRCKGTD